MNRLFSLEALAAHRESRRDGAELSLNAAPKKSSAVANDETIPQILHTGGKKARSVVHHMFCHQANDDESAACKQGSMPVTGTTEGLSCKNRGGKIPEYSQPKEPITQFQTSTSPRRRSDVRIVLIGTRTSAIGQACWSPEPANNQTP